MGVMKSRVALFLCGLLTTLLVLVILAVAGVLPVKTDKTVISDLPDKTEVQAFCPLTRKQAAFRLGQLQKKDFGTSYSLEETAPVLKPADAKPAK